MMTFDYKEWLIRNRCPNCGYDEIKPEHKYCAMCGHKLIR